MNANEQLQTTEGAERRFFRASSADFKKIPGSPIAYWVSEKMRDCFLKGTSLKKIASAKLGMRTGNNDKWLRRWHEVSFDESKYNASSSADAKGSGRKWFPYNKGGEFRRWYGNNEFVVFWKDDGYGIKAETLEKYPQLSWENLGWKITNESDFFKPSCTWTFISSSSFGVRVSLGGAIFDVAGSSAFPDEENLWSVAGFLCSRLAFDFLKLSNPTLNFQVANVNALPWIEPACKDELSTAVQRLVNLSRRDWNSYEISWDFTSLPLLHTCYRQPLLPTTYLKLREHWQKTTQEMLRLEKENNAIFIETYGLQDELLPDVPLEEITLTCNPVYRYGAGKTDEEYEELQRADTMRELISYAIGCMTGRYSPDTPGLQFAGGTYDHELACAAAPSFEPDEDGILPVLADAYFEDDVTTRFVEFLKATFGKEHLSENLRFVAEAIGIKDSESPQDAIRRFLAADFFKYHMRMYKRRPIYWLFSSGKEKAFQALVYLHRYTPATLARMRTGYLHELQNKTRARIEDMESGKDAATSTAQTNRINRDLTKLRKQLEELRVYDEKLHHYADQRIEIDLDDGVKHNYGLFGDLLAEVKAITGKKA